MSKIILFSLILIFYLLMVDADDCRCRCCAPLYCGQPLPKLFNVDQCWRNGGQQCQQLCINEYKSKCDADSLPTVIAVCRASVILSSNILLLLLLLTRFILSFLFK
jgi:hypothetical protein